MTDERGSMRERDYREKFDAAVGALKAEPRPEAPAGFEHSVWSEIAIQGRQDASDWFRRLVGGRFLVPAPVAAGVVAAAVLAGVTLGHSRALAYDRQAALDLEQRYVESIHPVMMSSGAPVAE